jgi:Mce-associated membrane protein
MEDQQLDPDDLTGENSDSGAPTVAAAEALNKDRNASADTAGRQFSRWLTTLVGIAAAAFVASGTFAGATLHTYLADRAAASTRNDVAHTAVAAVTTLWTYTPDTIDTLADRAAEYLSGDFNAQYRKFLEAAAAPNKQAQVTDSTEVVGAGVESLHGSDAVAIVFTNTTATSPLTKNIPSLKYVGYRLAMKHDGTRWLVTNMSTVSFMDLTPQL